MSQEMHKSTKVHLKVDEKYVQARISKDSKVELFLVDEQGAPDSVECCIHGQSTDGLTKKYVAFIFKYKSDPNLEATYYSLNIVEGILTLVKSAQPVNGMCSSVHDWLEMVDIKAGEDHQLRSTAGLIGSCKIHPKKPSKLCVPGSHCVHEQHEQTPVRFKQVPNS